MAVHHRHVIRLAAIAASVALIARAHGAIRCDGPFQIIPGGGSVATLYCQEENLARVARQGYGVSTSLARIRASEAEKERICRMIGHDNRVADICRRFRRDGGGRWPG